MANGMIVAEKGRYVITSVNMPEELLRRVDSLARDRNRSRSETMNMLVKFALEQEDSEGKRKAG